MLTGGEPSEGVIWRGGVAFDIWLSGLGGGDK